MKENIIGDRIEEKYTRYLNCETDTLELTIEEAIFILETDANLHYVEDLLQEAYKVILSDYKKNIKENEHKTEKIENQKAELAILNEKQKDFNKLQNTLSSYKGQFSNVIPILKIKDKIEELNNNRQYLSQFKDYKEKNYTNEEVVNNCVEVLQELLESEKIWKSYKN